MKLHASRTRAGIIGLALTGLLLLSGCATSSDAADGGLADADLLPAAEGTTQYPLTLESPFGDTVLEERPQRIAIVTASTLDTDALMALGGVPVFAPSTVERNTWLDPQMISDIEVLWTSEAGAEASAEAVAAAEPDLIVSLDSWDTLDETLFSKFADTAPVLYAEAYELSWQELTQLLGDTLDLSETAEKAIAKAEQAIADTRAAHPEFEGRTATQIMVYGEQYGASYNSAPGFGTDEILQQLGFTIPEAASQFVDDDLISDELVSLIDSDFLLISTSADDVSYFLDSPLVQAVPAVAEGRAIIDPADPESGINHLGWGLNVPSAVSLPWVVERIAQLAAQALS